MPKLRINRLPIPRASFLTSTFTSTRRHGHLTSHPSGIRNLNSSARRWTSRTVLAVESKRFDMRAVSNGVVGVGERREEVRLPNHRLLARAFHRTARSRKGEEAGTGKEHVLEEGDSHNVQHDASKEGKAERAKGDGSRGTSEGSGGSNRKAKEEFPEAPDTIGMQDERGGKD